MVPVGLAHTVQGVAALCGSIRACEAAGLPYQLIYTGVSDEEFHATQGLLGRELGPLRQMIPVRMDMVALGRARTLDPGACAHHPNEAPCRGKGFYRPKILHVDPMRRVRSCLYGLGLANLGTVVDRSLDAVINAFPHNPVARVFSDPAAVRERCGTQLAEGAHTCCRNI